MQHIKLKTQWGWKGSGKDRFYVVFPVELESTVCIRDVVELQKCQLNEDIVAMGAVSASIGRTENRTVRLLQEVDG